MGVSKLVWLVNASFNTRFAVHKVVVSGGELFNKNFIKYIIVCRCFRAYRKLSRHILSKLSNNPLWTKWN